VHALRALPETLATRVLERVGVAVQVFQLCLALVFQAWLDERVVLGSLSTSGGYNPSADVAALTLTLGVAFVALALAVIAVDAAVDVAALADKLTCGACCGGQRAEARALATLRQRADDIAMRVIVLEAAVDAQRVGGVDRSHDDGDGAPRRGGKAAAALTAPR
jgi:hypothetical protein